MREAMGGTLLVKLLMMFLVIYVIFIAMALNYAKAFKAKNGIIDYIEKYEGFNNLSQPEIDNYLKYERDGITIYAIEDTRSGDIYYEARTNDGKVIPDYPLPKVEGVNINRSTNIATDKYSRKYPVEYI